MKKALLFCILFLISCSTAQKAITPSKPFSPDIVFNDRCMIINVEDFDKATYKIYVYHINPYTDGPGATFALISNGDRHFLAMSKRMFELPEEVFTTAVNGVINALVTTTRRVAGLLEYNVPCLVFEVIMEGL